jgi:hypothetical protein
VIAVDTSQVAPTPVAESVKSTGAQLVAAFPPRPVVAAWPATEARRSAVADRVLAAPFALDNPLGQRNRRLGVLAVLRWRVSGPATVGSRQNGHDAAGAANGTESPIMRELSSLTQTECGHVTSSRACTMLLNPTLV